MFKIFRTIKITILILLISMFMFMFGCSFNIKEKFTDTFSENKYGLKETKYVIDASLLTDKKIEISLPKGFTAIGDTDETKNAYVSLYHSNINSTKEDYVLTYKINSYLEDDYETTLHTYNDMYENLLVSDIQELELKNKVKCRYYTITYFLSNEKLTDYVFEFNVSDVKVISKMGTTFYPIEMDVQEVGILLYENINGK